MKAAGTNAFSAVLKKRVFLLFLAIGSYMSMQAQVRLGLLGGIHSSKVLETNNLPGWDSTVKPFQSSRSGFQLGVILEVPIGRSGLFFQPADRKSTRLNSSHTVISY